MDAQDPNQDPHVCAARLLLPCAILSHNWPEHRPVCTSTIIDTRVMHSATKLGWPQGH